MSPLFTSLALLAAVFSSLTIALEIRRVHGDVDPARRLMRRKVGPYSGPGPLEYMKQLRATMDERLGGPRDVWCLLDSGKLNLCVPRARLCVCM